MRLHLKSLLLHTLNAFGNTQHTRSSTTGEIPNNNTTVTTNHERTQISSAPSMQSKHLTHSVFVDPAPLITLPSRLTKRASFTQSPRNMALAKQRSARRKNNDSITNKALSQTKFLRAFQEDTFAQITQSAPERVKRDTPTTLLPSIVQAAIPELNLALNAVHHELASGFSYLRETLTDYENLFTALLQQEQIRTKETAPAIEARLGPEIRDFFSQLISHLPLQNYLPSLDSPVHVSSVELCHTAYDQVFSTLPLTHERNFKGNLLPNTRDYLYILYKMKRGMDSTPAIKPEESAKNMLALVANMRANSNPSTRDQELAAIFASTDGMRDYYCQQAFDLYLGEQALTLDQYFDWQKVKAHIHTPTQIFSAVFERLPELKRQEFKSAMDDLGWRFTQAFSEGKALLNVLSTYSSAEKKIFTQAALIYYKILHPNEDLQGDALLSLHNHFAYQMRDEYQKNKLFIASSLHNPIPFASRFIATPTIFFGDIALENAQGKNFNQLLNEPSLRHILGFNLHSKEKQAALLRERLLEKGESADPRYPMGSFFHSVASVLIRVLQMQSQPIPAHFGTEAELMQRFIETANSWKATRNAPIDPTVLLGLHLASSSNEHIIDTNSAWGNKMQALNTYIQERWSAHMGASPQPFDRRQQALNILQKYSHNSRDHIEHHLQIFTESFSGAITAEFRMTLLDYFLKRADDNRSLRVSGTEINPHQLLAQAEENFNEELKTNPWIINRAKENLREKGIALTPADALNREIQQLAKTYNAQTEEERDNRRLLDAYEQIPLLGAFVSLVDGIATHDKDKIVGSIPVIGQAYNLEEGIRTHDAQRAIGAIPILGSGQSVIQSIRNGNAVGTYMSALGFVIDIETSGPSIAHAAHHGITQITTAIRHLNEHQLPNHLRLGLEHTAAAGEALGLPLRSVKFPTEIEHPLTLSPETSSIKNIKLFDINDPLNIAKDRSHTPLRQRLQQFIDTSTQFKKNDWAYIVDPDLGGIHEIFILARLAEEGDLLLLKEHVDGRYEMLDLETGQPKRNGMGIYKANINGKIEFYRGGLRGGGNLNWKKDNPQYAEALDAWRTQGGPASAAHEHIYEVIDSWMSYFNTYKSLDLGGHGLTNLPPLPNTVRFLDISSNRLTSLEQLPRDLLTLNVENNLLTTLPTLPGKLTVLKARANQLQALPNNLPTTLKELYIESNNLSSLPNSLPDTVQHIDISNNDITTLSISLPAQLSTLIAKHNQISELPSTWPSELKILKLDGNRLNTLSTLPQQLKVLSLSYNNPLQNWPNVWPSTLEELHTSHCGLTTITDMPTLPHSIEELDFSGNQLSTLPENLPNNLRQFLFYDNLVTTLPRLPAKLQELIGWKNKINTWPDVFPETLLEIDLQENHLRGSLLDNLPSRLETLALANNEIITLPAHLPSNLKLLIVNNNKLMILPELSPHLEKLWAQKNDLTELPVLPHSIRTLVVSDNHFSHLPTLPAKLRMLDVANNQLMDLPPLPTPLNSLVADNNHLTTLPDIPNQLNILRITRNQFTFLPDTILNRGSELTVIAWGNPFTQAFHTQIDLIPIAIRTDLRLTMPFLDNSLVSHQAAAEAATARPLSTAVGAWYNEMERIPIEQHWDHWQNEPKATSFSKFMDKLSGTLAAQHDSFKAQVRTFLTQASEDKEVRTLLFDIAHDGLGTCLDRTAFVYNQMTTAKIILDVTRGMYDHDPQVLIPIGRQLFRLEKLATLAAQEIAQTPIASLSGLPALDDVEVFLAYQVKLGTKLKLNFLPVKDMQYTSGLEEDRFIEIERVVKQEENTNFLKKYLTEWEPWQKVLQRSYPEAYQQASANIANLTESFEQALNDYLEKQGLPNTEQMRAEYAPKLANEMRTSIYQTLSEKFVTEHGLSDLLKPVWEETDSASTSHS